LRHLQALCRSLPGGRTSRQRLGRRNAAKKNSECSILRPLEKGKLLSISQGT